MCFFCVLPFSSSAVASIWITQTDKLEHSKRQGQHTAYWKIELYLRQNYIEPYCEKLTFVVPHGPTFFSLQGIDDI